MLCGLLMFFITAEFAADNSFFATSWREISSRRHKKYEAVLPFDQVD